MSLEPTQPAPPPAAQDVTKAGESAVEGAINGNEQPKPIPYDRVTVALAGELSAKANTLRTQIDDLDDQIFAEQDAHATRMRRLSAMRADTVAAWDYITRGLRVGV